MRAYPSQRHIEFFLLLSLFIHALVFWAADSWFFREHPDLIVFRLTPPDQRPFVRDKKVVLPPQHRPLSPPIFRTQPRTFQKLPDMLTQGITYQLSAPYLGERDWGYQKFDVNGVHTQWEHQTLHSWRDSLESVVALRKEVIPLEPLDPFEVEIVARVQHRSTVVLDSTGRFMRGFWYFPVYAIYVDDTQPWLRQFDGKNPYAEEIKILKHRLKEISQFTPMTAMIDPRYQVYSMSGNHSIECTAVPVDMIHRYSKFPFRDVLSYETMMQYPILVLRYIDVESTDSLVRYLREGGFVLVDPLQMDWLERELAFRIPGAMRRVDIEPNHRLMKAPYYLPGYALQGLELMDRLVAITVPQKYSLLYSPLLVNIVVYALTQPGSLAVRYQDQDGQAKFDLSPSKSITP